MMTITTVLFSWRTLRQILWTVAYKNLSNKQARSEAVALSESERVADNDAVTWRVSAAIQSTLPLTVIYGRQ